MDHVSHGFGETGVDTIEGNSSHSLRILALIHKPLNCQLGLKYHTLGADSTESKSSTRLVLLPGGWRIDVNKALHR